MPRFNYSMDLRVAYKLEVLKQKPFEKIINFFGRVDTAIKNFFENFNRKDDKVAIVTRMYFQLGIFIGGLREDIKAKLLEKEDIKDIIAMAIDYAQTLEFIQKSKGRLPLSNEDAQLHTLNATGRNMKEGGTSETEDEELEAEMVSLMKRYQGKFVRKQFHMQKRRSENESTFTGKRYNYGCTGHVSQNCQQPRKTGIQAVEDKNEDDASESYCKYCI